jgi:two-component system, chemotaxis family, response regulator Rcp1
MHPDFHILLVDDSLADVKIIERALIESNIQHRLTVIHDGKRALEYLQRLHHPEVPADREPDLILLDLNLPGIDGTQILIEIKNDLYLKTIPVVVLTTSRREEDVLSTYQAGANTYIQKPAEFPHYRDLVITLRDYWHGTALRVPRDRPRPLKT